MFEKDYFLSLVLIKIHLNIINLNKFFKVWKRKIF